MRMLARLRNRFPASRSDPGSADASSEQQRLPIARYDQLADRQVIKELSHLSQVELATVEAYERSHRDRPVVLNRLRWLKGSEPLPGYDALEPVAIVGALAEGDSAKLRAVRSYERRHRVRREILNEVARVLPASRAGVAEVRAKEEQATLVQAGVRSDPPERRS